MSHTSPKRTSRREAQFKEIFGSPKKAPKTRRRREVRGLWPTSPAYKCIRALFLTGAALTALSYGFIHGILTNPELMSRLLRYPVPQGAVLTVSSDAEAILYGCGVFTGLCLLLMIVVRCRRM